jgi:penicillin amidase
VLTKVLGDRKLQEQLQQASQHPGQSGQPGRPRYDDLLPLWDNGEYFPLAFSRVKVERVTRHRLKLIPAAR